MKKYFLLKLAMLCTIIALAQQTAMKGYPAGTMAGEARLLSSYGSYSNAVSSKIFTVEVPASGNYYISSLVNIQAGKALTVQVDNTPGEYLQAERSGWQFGQAGNRPVFLQAGKHVISIRGTDAMIPMVEELNITKESLPGGNKIPAAIEAFLQRNELLKAQPVPVFKAASQSGDETNLVLPNPQGIYDHAVDEAFTYSHYSVVYLTAGNHTFTTSGSTINRALTVFNSSDYTYSWSNVNGGPGGESGLYLIVGLAGYYAVTLRPVTDGQTGTTNIILDGNTLVSNAVIGGRRFGMSSLRGGDMNFFTCRLTAGDTRMFVSRYASSSVRGYNDDYYGGGGTWAWGTSSRIKKNFNGNDSVQYAFVCAYSPASTGVCDVYMGTGNSNLPVLEPQNFPQLTTDDAIMTAPMSNGYYNCIAWSGGVTSTSIWPPSAYSTYSCNSGNELQCFDNFYNNVPVRYPGAWNYTRSGATSANAVVDLWKTASAYTHASVRKPGNNNPHGYDWESKPGSLDRTLHPRNALTNANWYGSVSNYYKPTGTYARNAGAAYAFESDQDAIKAGVAVYDKASLTRGAVGKLDRLLRNNPAAAKDQFDELYKAWDATKAANASLSDPAMYCKNKAYRALEQFAMVNETVAMLKAFDKFIQGDHIIGELVWTLTKNRYGKLLDQVKTERLANLYDEQGRYRVHGDHDNGVLYIEKILQEMEPGITLAPATDNMQVTVSPNPVANILKVQVAVTKTSRLGIVISSAQTGLKQAIQKEMTVGAGTHQYSFAVSNIAGSAGDILAVQVMLDGVLKTVKVVVMK